MTTEAESVTTGAGSTSGLSRAEAERLAAAYVGAYNNRDREAMLALQHPDVVSYPTNLYERRTKLIGLDDVRRWWETLEAANRWYTVRVIEVRLLLRDRFMILGEVLDDPAATTALSPWAIAVRIKDGLIIESRSYLSDTDTLTKLGLLG